MGYVLFSGCVTGIAGDQFRGNSPVSGPDGGKEHRTAQLYGGAAWKMCGKGLVEAVCIGACAPAVFLWQNPDGNGHRFCTTGKNPVTGGTVSGSFPGASAEGAVRKSAEGHTLASSDHELRT